ncbi:LysR family transcriptional regulator [Propionispira raffinosivorans]|uniref:LysR family transcriptional regulator n=1 Tax=Propionispira raffinosivorans TaxID=86959 RepID=UPI002481464C|nr:LysR family transcriptional regulator [Propionispira raffinosivorans]
MIILEIRQLKTFMSIVKLGSFSQTAQLLGYTQSTVTTHIQLLEKEFNTVFFERFGHQLMLTTDGERLYEYAEQITKLSEAAKNELDHFDIPKGSLILGIPESVCMYYLTDVLKEYVSLYPDVELKLRLGIGSDFRNLLRKNMMDVAFFLEKKVKDRDFVSEFLWAEPIVMVAAPNHPLTKLKRVKVQNLTGQILVFTDSISHYQTVLEEYLEKSSITPRTILEIGQIYTIKQFVKSQLGITILPLAAVKTEIEAGELVALPWQGIDLDTNTYIVHHKDKWLSLPIRAFIKLVRERLVE